MYADDIDSAEKELWNALLAVQAGDLPFARSSAARALSAIRDAWLSRKNEVENEQNTRLLDRRATLR